VERCAGNDQCDLPECSLFAVAIVRFN
jgi:hypothetical protein